MRIGERVKAARLRAGLKTQSDLAKRLDESQKQISVWEASSNLGWEKLERIAEGLNTTAEEIVVLGKQGGQATEQLRKEFRDHLSESQFLTAPEILGRLKRRTKARRQLDQVTNLFVSLRDDITIWPPSYEGAYPDFVLAVAESYTSFVTEDVKWQSTVKSSTVEAVQNVACDYYVIARTHGPSIEVILNHYEVGDSETEARVREVFSQLTENRELLTSVGWLVREEYRDLWMVLDEIPKDLSQSDLEALTRGIRSLVRMVNQVRRTG